MRILPIISRSKDNQSMKFGQLIEYNMRTNVYKKSYTICDGETIPRPFYSLLLLYAKLRVIEVYGN